MSALVGIRSGLSAVSLVVWVDGRPERGARIFLPTNTLDFGGAVQTIPESGPFVAARKWLHQNGFRAKLVAAV